MSTMSIDVKHSVLINCNIIAAYEAFTSAANIVHFFPNEAKGDMKTGTVVEWTWGNQMCPVTVLDIVDNEKVVFSWQAFNVEYDTITTFTFEEKDGKTKVTARETGWGMGDSDLKSVIEHSAGWMHCLLCMKAWLEHGIDLRV